MAVNTSHNLENVLDESIILARDPSALAHQESVRKARMWLRNLVLIQTPKEIKEQALFH